MLYGQLDWKESIGKAFGDVGKMMINGIFKYLSSESSKPVLYEKHIKF